MIKGLYSNGPFISVSGGNPGSTYIPPYNALGIGNMRYNSSTQNIEVSDGSSWVILTSTTASVSLTTEAISLLAWVQTKRDEERKLVELAETNPTLKDLINQVKEKQEQIKIVQSLIKEEEKV